MSMDDRSETRQERRERKRNAKREWIPKHGSGLRRLIPDAALKMARKRLKRPRRA
jgi:hypothetical protein